VLTLPFFGTKKTPQAARWFWRDTSQGFIFFSPALTASALSSGYGKVTFLKNVSPLLFPWAFTKKQLSSDGAYGKEGDTMYYTQFNSPLCEIILVGDVEGISHLHLNTGEGKRKFRISDSWEKNDAFYAETKKQIDELFKGRRTRFDIKLNPRGTDFQKKVWNELVKIPCGTVCSYKDIAAALGNTKASRAVGTANGKNPIPLIIPCHRVIGADGGLGGFAHGLSIKQKLIDFEKETSLKNNH